MIYIIKKQQETSNFLNLTLGLKLIFYFPEICQQANIQTKDRRSCGFHLKIHIQTLTTIMCYRELNIYLGDQVMG